MSYRRVVCSPRGGELHETAALAGLPVEPAVGAVGQRILAPYTFSTFMAISTLRSDTMTDRYSSQSGCSPAAAR